jgi:carboxyl-terminal processing protease
MSRGNLTWLIAVPMLVMTAFSLTFSAPTRDRDKDYQRVKLIVDVLAEVDRHYVRELDEKQKTRLVEDMINGGLERLDPYSAYLNEEEFRAFNSQTEGNFGGIGIQMGVDPKTGNLQVLTPMVGTPAWEAGILAGDILVKINDTPADGMRMNEAVRLIQGEPGSPISITVQHEFTRKIETYAIKRAKIEVQTVLGWSRLDDNPREWDYMADKEKGIAYIRLVQFNDNTTKEMIRAMEKIQKDGATALVLDLRDNPGGLLKSAIEVSDLFLTQGRIVSTKDRNERGQSWDAKADGTVFEPAATHPMVILVNRNSASASEIVSAALQDHQRAIVIGERSYGKGSVQKVIRLTDGDAPTALKLTTDSYWRPNGKNIHRHPDSKESDEWGVKPNENFEIIMKDEERLEYMRWRRAKDIFRTKDQPKPEEKDAKPFTDRAMEKALEHLRKQIGG